MLRIRLIEEAETEFHAARSYYDDCDSALGERFTSAVEAKLRSIQEHPDLYAITQANVREAILTSFPYVIYFTVRDETVDVWAVFHQSRDPDIWQSRLKE